jgi:uncharacterized protein
MDAFLSSPWYDKLFWLFFAAIILWVAAIWIKVIIETIRSARPLPKRGGRAKSAGGGFSESASLGIVSYESSSDSASTEIASGDTGGGSDFSGGGGESGGGGASGSWS